MKFREIDPDVSLKDQMRAEKSPVVLINTLSVDAGEVDALLEAWREDALYFASQPGFVATQLHRGIGGSATFLNYAVWESVSHFHAAFSNQAFAAALEKYPPSTVASPFLFEKIAVPGVCES